MICRARFTAFPLHMMPLAALIVVSLGVGCVAALTGILILGERADAAASHPLIAATVCGLMIGIGMLVILPDTMEALVHEAGWPVERVMLLFISSILAMFCIDHCFLEHEHLPPAGNSAPALATETALTPAECTSATAVAADDFAAGIDSDAARVSHIAQGCEPCEPDEQVSDLAQDCEPCEPCEPDEPEPNSPPPSPACAQRTSTAAQQQPPPSQPPPSQPPRQPPALQSTRTCECEDCERGDTFAAEEL